MSLVRRSILVEATCPYCRAVVQIEDGGPEEEDHVIGPEQMIEPTRLALTRDYRMIHHVSNGPDTSWTRHEWLTEQHPRLTRVHSLHVSLVPRPGRRSGR